MLAAKSSTPSLAPSTYLLFVALSLALFWTARHNPFVLDDVSKIQWNTDLRGSHLPIRELLAPYANGKNELRSDPSRPLTYLCYWLCWQLSSGQPWSFHLLSALLHGLNAALLIHLICQRLPLRSRTERMGAGFVGLLFLTSPLLAGSVLYAFGLSDLLSTTLTLAALVHASGARVIHMFTVLLFALALACKQSALILPLLIWLTWRLDGPVSSSEFRRLWPLLMLAAIHTATRWWFLGGWGDLEAHGDLPNATSYFLAEGPVLWRYLWQFVSFERLTIDHALPLDANSMAVQIGAWLGVTVASLFALILIRRHSPLKYGGWAWLCYILTMLPTSSVLPTVDLWVERRAYWSISLLLVGLGCAMIPSIARAPRWLMVATVSLVCVSLSFQMIVTLHRTQVYGSAENLWQEALAVDPRNPRANLNLANDRAAHKRYEEARQILENLLQLQPENALIYAKLAFIYHQVDNPARDPQKARSLYAKSFELDPNNMVALLNASGLEMTLGAPDRAVSLAERAVQLNPNFAYGHLVAGEALLLLEQPDRAAAQFQTALKLDPGLKEARAHLLNLNHFTPGPHP